MKERKKERRKKERKGPVPPNSSVNTRKHGLTLPLLHAHNSSTHSDLTFSNTNPQPIPGPHRPSPASLPAPTLMIHSVRCVKAPLTRKKGFSVTYVTTVFIWTPSSPPSPPSLLGYENIPCVPLLPPHPRVHCDTSAFPLPSLTLTLTEHHLGQKKKTPSLVRTKLKTAFSPACDEFWPYTHVHAYNEGSGFNNQV